MKKLMFVFIFIALVIPVFSQNNSGNNEARVYYVSLPVEKVYPTENGYLVSYRKGMNKIGYVGLPTEWFVNAAGTAEMIVMPKGSSWPTISIFYLEGKFSHVKLYVHNSKGHQTWGNIPDSTDVSKYFKDAESFNIEFE